MRMDSGDSKALKLPVLCSGPLLSSFSPDFWVSAFIDLFCRGDCKERYLPEQYPLVCFYKTPVSVEVRYAHIA